MLPHSPNRCGIACLMLAAMLASTGSVSSKAPVDQVPIEFTAMAVKGDVSVDDASNPTKLSFDLKSTFRLGPNSNGINPLAEGLTLNLEYPTSALACLTVSIPGGCFAQTGNGYRAQSFQNCGQNGLLVVIAQCQNASQTADEIPPFFELLQAINKSDLRVTPDPDGRWDLKLSIDFLASPNAPIAGIIAVLRSPNKVRLTIGNDHGDVSIAKLTFNGEN